MNKLSNIQRAKILGIALGTILLAAALVWFGVGAQHTELTVTRNKITEIRTELHEAEALARRQNEIAGSLHSRGELLAKIEAALAPDLDPYAWLIKTMSLFLRSHREISIDSYSPPEISDNGVIPRFPYRWATFHLKGAGSYDDWKKFFIAFQYDYPYFRIQNPCFSANTALGMEGEKLRVTFDIVVPLTSSGGSAK